MQIQLVIFILLWYLIFPLVFSLSLRHQFSFLYNNCYPFYFVTFWFTLSLWYRGFPFSYIPGFSNSLTPVFLFSLTPGFVSLWDLVIPFSLILGFSFLFDTSFSLFLWHLVWLSLFIPLHLYLIFFKLKNFFFFKSLNP